MRRFNRPGVWILFHIAFGTLAASPLAAAPFLTGSSDYYHTRINWQVFADFAPGNPQPKSGDYTYVYWIESLEDPTKLYWFSLFGPAEPLQFGEVTGTGFIADTGLAPIEWTNDNWKFSFGGVDFPVGTRTASLYLHSPAEPGAHYAVPYSCNPLVCDPVSGLAIGPVSGPGVDRADYNGDGAISLDDFDAWRTAFGVTNSRADGNRDGVVDAADYTVWREAYGQYDFGGFNASTVPEPSLAALVLTALLNCGFIGRCRR
jgi:hypothetical protein